MMPPRQPLIVVRLSDHGGQYRISLTCGACGHQRQASPVTFAAMTSWDTLLADVCRRLRCSMCDAREVTATYRRETKRDG